MNFLSKLAFASQSWMVGGFLLAHWDLVDDSSHFLKTVLHTGRQRPIKTALCLFIPGPGICHIHELCSKSDAHHLAPASHDSWGLTLEIVARIRRSLHTVYTVRTEHRPFYGALALGPQTVRFLGFPLSGEHFARHLLHALLATGMVVV